MNKAVAIDADYEVRTFRTPSQPERRIAAAVLHRAAIDLCLCREGSESWKQSARFFQSTEFYLGSFEWYAQACRINPDSVREFLFDPTRTFKEKHRILLRAYSKVKNYLRDCE